MINPQMYAVEIEHVLCKVFRCERFGVGGLVNSDHIRQHPFHAMMCALSCIYAYADAEKKRAIEKFFTDYSFYADWNIDTILSFESPDKIMDGATYTLDFNNGAEAIEKMIAEFSAICS